MQREARLQRQIVQALASRGIYAVRLRPMGRAGWPDLYAILPASGRAVHLEVKRAGGRTTRLQDATLAELEAAGALVGVVTSAAEALALVEAAA